MKEKKTLKERMESAKKKAKEWWEENKEFAILACVSIVTSGALFAIGEKDGEKRGQDKGWKEHADWIIDKCGEDPTTIWEHDDSGNKLIMDAIVTKRFYDAFQHPEKVKWYDDGSFDYVDELKNGD